jgi:dihydrofolate reductase
MGRLKFDISVSLDGYVAGPDLTLDDPIGRNGMLLHEWAFATKTFSEMQGRPGGETGIDDDVAAEHFENVGATIMGRRMYSGGEGPWDDDPNANGWWGDDPPFHHEVFVLTSHPREPLQMQGGTIFNFVTEGIESALERARHAAGDEDVQIGGGGQAIQQYLNAGAVDEFQLHVVPVFLGEGVRLFDDHVTDPPGRLELKRAIQTPSGVAHLSYESASR